jgi:hypothetical protein
MVAYMFYSRDCYPMVLLHIHCNGHHLTFKTPYVYAYIYNGCLVFSIMFTVSSDVKRPIITESNNII